MTGKRKFQILAACALIFVGILTVMYKKSQSAQQLNVYGNLSLIENFDVQQVKGEYFILHFWAKWCEPCAEEIPHVVEFARNAQFHKPLKVLAVSLDSDLDESRMILPNQGKNLPANFILVLDREHKAAEAMGSYQYPETYFIDPAGAVIEKWIGPQKWNKPEVLEFFKQKVL